MCDGDDVIELSSDDEFGSPPPKKIKPTTIIEKDILKKLNKLTEITTAVCQEKKPFLKNNGTEESRLTIIIESDEKSKENEVNVVNLTDESFEENLLENNHNDSFEDNLSEKDNNVSTDCFIVGSDSEIEEELQNLPSEELNANHDKEEFKVEAKHDLKVDIPVKDNVENGILNRPSTSTASDAHKLLDELLETCRKSLKGSKYENRILPIFPKLKNNFDKCDHIHKEPYFQRMLRDYINTAKISAPEAVVSFQRIFSYLLDHIHGGDTVEVTKEELIKIKKLAKTCKLILKRLRKLEEAEVNFDEEEDSTYMQIERYSQRLNKIYNKYCQLLNKNPYAGRLLYERFQFVASKYNEINRYITKSYKNNRFPTYYDVEKSIRKCVAKNNMGLSEAEIKEESKNCFTKMGNLLQMRRKKELYEVHCGFITLNEDPANTDENLKVKLQESMQEGDKKMKEVVDKYVKLQENNHPVELSEDSDDSNYKETDSESEEV